MLNLQYSILMSVYDKDSPVFLRESILSMLRQTCPAEQFVLVKDGPLNNELNLVIEDYVCANPSLFTVIELEKNGGLGMALDRGLEICRNELVARMDADDISLPERCEKQLFLFASDSCLSIVGTDMDEFEEIPSFVATSRVVPRTHAEIVQYSKRRNPFNHPTVMFKKTDVIRCGGYGMVRKRQDYDLFSRMVHSGCNAANIDQSLLLFRANEDNYRRRKSWPGCKGTIDVIFRNKKRGYCSTLDAIIAVVGQLFIYAAPFPIMKWFSDTFLRKKKA